ncbi:MAG TPA: peptide chain release factor N(5)-glutamine methyltransferase [Methylomirabilota bacterium]|nr:peptide chain release factor N(5)-glutamine methyltransferase [Methylomirabilota bacterium]
MSPAGVLACAAEVAAVLADAAARLRAAGLATGRLDAECLLARALGTTRLGLYTRQPGPIPAAARAEFDRLLARRLGHEPIQYLVGEAEFAGVSLRVGRGVFIPRPETEALVARALALGPAAAGVAVDVCAGSGALACALARARPAWAVWALERDAAPVAYARANVAALGLEGRVEVLEGDLFGPLAGRLRLGTVDVVVANPPYLAAPVLPALPVEVREWEPAAALDGGADGLAVIRRLVAEAPVWLRPGGVLLVEIGEEHGPAAAALIRREARYAGGAIHRDFQGRERILEARRR